MAAPLAMGATITIEALDVRGSGVFGHPDATATLNGGAFPGTLVADPLNIEVTYANLDLDADGTPNDTVNFTLTATQAPSMSTGMRAWGQGIDTGFGSLNDVTFSVSSVSGNATDSGYPIMFDGFTGGAIGVGGGGALDRTADINGLPAAVNSASTGSFQFVIDAVDFAPTATILYTNSGGTSGAISARHHDLQFSVVPEPTSAALLALGAVALVARRK